MAASMSFEEPFSSSSAIICTLQVSTSLDVAGMGRGLAQVGLLGQSLVAHRLRQQPSLHAHSITTCEFFTVFPLD